MKFSIITPSYNQGQFIEETINSVITQTGDFDIEYFVMDGGSTDDTVNILKDFANKLSQNSRIKFHWTSAADNGQVDAINKGLAKASGDIVAYINSDDYYLPGAFSNVAKHFSSHPNSLWLVGNCQVSDQRLSWTFWLKHLWPVQYFRSALLVFNTINQPSVFLRKSLVDKVGKFDSLYPASFDHDYWIRCSSVLLPSRIYKALSVFRVHTNSISSSNYTNQLEQDYKIIKQYTNNKIVLFIHKTGQIIVNAIYKKTKQ